MVSIKGCADSQIRALEGWFCPGNRGSRIKDSPVNVLRETRISPLHQRTFLRLGGVRPGGQRGRCGGNSEVLTRWARGVLMRRFLTAIVVVFAATVVLVGCNDYGNTFQGNTGA